MQNHHALVAMMIAVATLGAGPVAAQLDGSRQVAPAPAHECDRLAEPPRNQSGYAPVAGQGVDLPQLDVPSARAACDRAMREWPDESRYVAYAGRVAGAGQNSVEAQRLWKVAADRGNPLAQAWLGSLHQFGAAGFTHDCAEAMRLYRLAGGQGSDLGNFLLAGSLIDSRCGGSMQNVEAARLARSAAEHGFAPAQKFMGDAIWNGWVGFSADMMAARPWYLLAAEQGDAGAMEQLARIALLTRDSAGYDYWTRRQGRPADR